LLSTGNNAIVPIAENLYY